MHLVQYLLHVYLFTLWVVTSWTMLHLLLFIDKSRLNGILHQTQKRLIFLTHHLQLQFLIMVDLFQRLNSQLLLLNQFFIRRNDRPDNLTTVRQFWLSWCELLFNLSWSIRISDILFINLLFFYHRKTLNGLLLNLYW